MPREPHQVHPALEVLGDRSVPAADVFVRHRTLFIVGTRGADTVLLSQSANRLIVSQPGILDKAFRLGQVHKVVVNNFGTEDAFANLSTFSVRGFGNAPGTLTAFQQAGAFNSFLARFSPRQRGFVSLLEANLRTSIFPLSLLSTALPLVSPSASFGEPMLFDMGQTGFFTPSALPTPLMGDIPLTLALSPGLNLSDLRYSVDANGFVVQQFI